MCAGGANRNAGTKLDATWTILDLAVAVTLAVDLTLSLSLSLGLTVRLLTRTRLGVSIRCWSSMIMMYRHGWRSSKAGG
jgi:hypothetical protein